MNESPLAGGPASALPLVLALLLAPLLSGVIHRTKARFAGRVGPPLLQPYFDLARLVQKGAVYSQSTTLVFRLAPSVILASMLAALLVVPLGNCRSPLAFWGDLILLVYVLATARLLLVLGALDTGSSFEGMGASREVSFAALAEPALLLSLAAIARHTEAISLSQMHAALTPSLWLSGGLPLALVAAALVVLLLAENSRIPFDDPNTHLELTMIHEVLVLDHSGPDLAYILYAQALKLWLLAALVVSLILPTRTGWAALDLLLALGGIFAMAVLVGVIESVMARLRLIRVPQLLVGAATLAALALVLEYQG